MYICQLWTRCGCQDVLANSIAHPLQWQGTSTRSLLGKTLRHRPVWNHARKSGPEREVGFSSCCRHQTCSLPQANLPTASPTILPSTSEPHFTFQTHSALLPLYLDPLVPAGRLQPSTSVASSTLISALLERLLQPPSQQSAPAKEAQYIGS